MKIGTKCGFNKEQLLCSVGKGLPFLEFHTNIEDFSGDINFKEIKHILDKNNVKCHAIHAPIADSFGRKETITIGTFYKEQRKENIELFKKCIQLANFLCGTKTPIVVSHIGTGYKLSDKTHNNFTREYIDTILNEAKEDLIIINNYIKEHYPNTIFVVENMPNMAYSANNEPYSWYFGQKEDLANFITTLNLENIKTCLDICHLTTTMRVDKMHNPFIEKTLSDYIKAYSSSLKLVHLNNCVNLGEITPYHSQPFNADSQNDLELLEEFFKGIDSNNIDCFITLEINETDYLTQTNCDKTITCVKKVLESLGLNMSSK